MYVWRLLFTHHSVGYARWQGTLSALSSPAPMGRVHIHVKERLRHLLHGRIQLRIARRHLPHVLAEGLARAVPLLR